MTSLRILGIMLLLFCAACDRPAERTPNKLGHYAPNIHLAPILQSNMPELTNWHGLRGKAVVLEFCATWCKDCVSSIGHMNTLSTSFKDKPVQFITVFDESRPVVEKFLQSHPIKGWVGIDAEATAFRAFSPSNIKGIPYTVLISKKGIVTQNAYPTQVTEKDIEALLSVQ